MNETRDPVQIGPHGGGVFKTKGAAESALKSKKLDPAKFTTVEFKEGFVITTIEDAPWYTQTSQVGGLPGAPATQENPPVAKAKPDGKDPLIQTRVEKDGSKTVTNFRLPPDRPAFARVRFHNKANENDPTDVVLPVQGDSLVVKRNVVTIIPNAYREAADHATFEKFEVKPGNQRKVIATIQKYPYDFLGAATEQEYLLAKSQGTKAQADANERDVRAAV